MMAVAGHLLLLAAVHGLTRPSLPSGSLTRPSLLSAPLTHLDAPATKYLWRLLRRGDDPFKWWQRGVGLEEAGGAGLGSSARMHMMGAYRPLDDVATLALETTAADGTRKLLLRLADGLEVETVLIPPLPPTGRQVASNARTRTTLCISSQVGCRQGCAFCATGRMGRLRDLTTDEILAQAHIARRVAVSASLPPVANVVFMGMGEPADNAANVRTAVVSLVDPDRFGFSRQSVVISTVAPSPRAFTDIAATGVVLAWSLHAADARLRKMLVPTAQYSPSALRDGLCEALRARPPRRRRLLIEYVLIADVNDHVYDAERLAAFVQPLHDACHHKARHSKRTGVLVNLIPFNPGQQHDESGELPQHQREAFDAHRGILRHKLFRRPTLDAVDAFQATLRARGVWTSVTAGHSPALLPPSATMSNHHPPSTNPPPPRTTWIQVRAARGDDTASACGQLITDRSRRRAKTDPQVFIGKEALSEVALREAGRSEAGRSEAQPKQLSEVVRGQTERLLESAGSAMAYRCCVACEGTGQRFIRRRRQARARAERVAPPTRPCRCCAGVGLMEISAPSSSLPSSVRPTTPSSALEEFEDWARTKPAVTRLSVAIIGGGLGGLALALSLQQVCCLPCTCLAPLYVYV